MRVASVTMYGNGRVTLWYEGRDSQSDYFPAIHDSSQRRALEILAEDGVTEGCHISASNGREAGEPMPKTCRSALRFAKRAGLPFRDDVRFPVRDTYEAAEADMALEPGLKAEVIGTGWGFRAVVRDQNATAPAEAAEQRTARPLAPVIPIRPVAAVAPVINHDEDDEPALARRFE